MFRGRQVEILDDDTKQVKNAEGYLKFNESGSGTGDIHLKRLIG